MFAARIEQMMRGLLDRPRPARYRVERALEVGELFLDPGAELEELGPLELKGKSAPVEALVVNGL